MIRSQWSRRFEPRRLTLAILTVASVATLGIVAPSVASAHGSRDGNWVTAWSAAPQGPSTFSQFGAETVSGFQYTKIAQKVVPPPPTFFDQTVRQVMYLHFGGDAVRILSSATKKGPPEI